MYIKLNQWPIVKPNDNGIRPNGKINECFYCDQKVGTLHKENCITIEKIVRYNIIVNNKIVGYVDNYEPYYWDDQKCERVRNESSWCKSNFFHKINFVDEEAEKILTEIFEKEECLCKFYRVQVQCVLDEGPFIETRDRLLGQN